MIGVVAQLSPGLKFVDIMVDGLALGSIYALLTFGFVLVFKATSAVNFAHGAVAAAGAYITFLMAVTFNFPGRFVPFLPVWLQWVLAAVVAIALTAVLGLVLERLFIRPMVGESLFAVAIITVGMNLIVRTVVDDYIGIESRPLGDPWKIGLFDIGGITIAHTQVIMIGSTVVILAGLAFFFRSRLGVAMRAVSFDQEAAMAQGISVGKVFAITWAIAAALAAVAGIFTTMFPRGVGVGRFTAFIAIRAFPAAIIGGLDSVVGAVVGGLMVGIAEVTAGAYLGHITWLGAGFSGIVPWLLMMVVLLVRPHGLFGTEEIRRV